MELKLFPPTRNWSAHQSLLDFVANNSDAYQRLILNSPNRCLSDLLRIFWSENEGLSSMSIAVRDKNWQSLDKYLENCVNAYLIDDIEPSQAFSMIHKFREDFSELIWVYASQTQQRDLLQVLNTIADHCYYILSRCYLRSNLTNAGKERVSRIKAEQQRQISEVRLRALYRNSSDQIFLVDNDLKVLFINHTPPGLKKSEVIGKNLLQFQSGDNIAIIEKKLRSVIKTGRKTQYQSTQEIQGKTHYYHSTVAPVKINGRMEGAAIISRDITDQKRSELDLKKLNEDLEKLVEERTRNLKAINAELESFSYTVSHDLRAPLRAIAGFARILEKKTEEKLNKDELRYLGIITSNVEKMGRLIDDLLSFSRMGKVKKVMSRFSISDLAREVIEEIRGNLDENQDPLFKIDEQMPAVIADREMLRQVLLNLLGNAVKFSSTNENPVIEIGHSSSDKKEIIFYVRDNGVGFEMEYGHKLFGIFQRLHSEDEFEGTGVGLAIVQRIIHRHQGKVWAESKQGEGATFYFTIPIKTEKSWI